MKKAGKPAKASRPGRITVMSETIIELDADDVAECLRRAGYAVAPEP